MKISDIQPATLAYIEQISGKQGQAALDAYMQNTGWKRDSGGRFQVPTGARLAQAESMARLGPRRVWSECDGRRLAKKFLA